MKKLHPNARIMFYLSNSLGLFFFLMIFQFPLMIMTIAGEISTVFPSGLMFFGLLFAFIVPAPFAQLTYEAFGYELQKDRISIERGIIWKKNVFIPYERVQNVDIIRGPIARILGLCDLQIQTAGATQVLVEGRIPGITVSEATRLKDEILSIVSNRL